MRSIEPAVPNVLWQRKTGALQQVQTELHSMAFLFSLNILLIWFLLVIKARMGQKCTSSWFQLYVWQWDWHFCWGQVQQVKKRCGMVAGKTDVLCYLCNEWKVEDGTYFIRDRKEFAWAGKTWAGGKGKRNHSSSRGWDDEQLHWQKELWMSAGRWQMRSKDLKMVKWWHRHKMLHVG